MKSEYVIIPIRTLDVGEQIRSGALIVTVREVNDDGSYMVDIEYEIDEIVENGRGNVGIK